jgi:hypothetical protein
MLPVRNIAVNPNAAKLVRQQASSVGYKNPETRTTSKDLKMSSGFRNGERPIRDTGGGIAKISQMRYKIP